jgi:hypothetical protein
MRGNRTQGTFANNLRHAEGVRGEAVEDVVLLADLDVAG